MLKNTLLFLCCIRLLFAEEIDLYKYEKAVYSQNGEDGILAKIFQVIGPDALFCVEIGAYDGITASNTLLLRLQGWEGVLLDKNFENPEMSLYKEFITAENIPQLFDRYDVPREFDLLSIDIDYNDFYIWNALADQYRPYVVVIEYNGTLPSDEDMVVQYHPYFCGDGTDYFGASILSFYHLGRSKGYSLVYAESQGVNLFFIRDDLIEKKQLVFKDINDVNKLYRRYGNEVRHDLKHRKYLSSKEMIP